MAVGSLRFQGQQGKFNKISFGTVCRVILNHLFLVIALLYLIILHRYFPFLFSLLVSASPVLICTALLLGALLIHGQRNDHRVGNREERNNVIEVSNSGVVDYAYTSDRDGIFMKERLGEVQNGIVEKEMTVSRGFTTSDRDYSNATVRQSSNQKDEGKQGFQFATFDFHDVQRHNLQAPNFDEKHDKVQNDVGMQDHSDSSFNSQKHVDSAAEYESSYSESDGAEKSPLDALVAGVIPTLQETHPLLEDPLHSHTLHVHANHEATLKSEEQSLDSDHSSEVSDEETDYRDDEEDDEKDEDETPKAEDSDTPSPFAWTDNDQRILQELRSSEIEKNEHLESLIARAEDDGSDEMEDDDEVGSTEDIDDDVDVDVDVDDDEEDENPGVEKDGSKHVTLWTEEDEKNLRHLGCSELERNLRLENLLARRRAKRNFSMISERNLIDLDHSDLPFPVAPITTTRVNPFDVPDDSTHHPNLPPIPGSAPSVSLPRKNPFDSPCTSPRRTQKLSADTIKEEPVETNLNNAVHHEIGSSSTRYNAIGHVPKPDFMDIHRKEALFRRYESFSSGYNVMAEPSTHDFMDFDRRDFVFRRHETFNTRSAFPSFFSSDKPVFVPEQVHGEVRHPSFNRQSSRDSESAESESSSDTESSNAPVSQEYEGRDQETEATFEHHQDDDAPNEGDHTSSHVETGSESSEVPDSLYDDHHEHLSESTEMNEDPLYQKQEILQESHENPDATSSSSSSSAPSSPVHHVESVVNESPIEQQVEESGFSRKDSLNMSEASHMSTDDDHHPVEPVYDTSPSGVEKNTAFSHPSQLS